MPRIVGIAGKRPPKLKQLVDRYLNKGVRVAAIAVDDNEVNWKKFIREFH